MTPALGNERTLTRFQFVCLSIALIPHLTEIAAAYWFNQFCTFGVFVALSAALCLCIALGSSITFFTGWVEWVVRKDALARKIQIVSLVYSLSSVLSLATLFLICPIVADYSRHKLESEFVLVVAAIENYQKDHGGQPPETLLQLQPRYIDKANGDGFWTPQFNYSRYPAPQTDWDLYIEKLCTRFLYHSSQIYPINSAENRTIRVGNRVFLLIEPD